MHGLADSFAISVALAMFALASPAAVPTTELPNIA